MARFAPELTRSATSTRPVDSLTDLTRLLGRLQQTVLRADPERERRLRTSEYERKKVETNIQCARSLLAKMEQEASTVKVLARRQTLQADLNRKREVLEQLMDRMLDLEELGGVVVDDGDDGDDGDDNENSEGEDIFSEIIATPSESMDSRSPDVQPEEPDDDDPTAPGESSEGPIPDMLEPPRPHQQAQAEEERGEEEEEEEAEERIIDEKNPGRQETMTSQTLRSRYRGEPGGEKDEKGRDTAQTTATATTATATATATTTATALFGHPRNASVAQTATTEAILDHQRAEQDALSDSILKMAGELKASSKAFSLSLEEDKNVVTRAGEGLDKSERGLEAASRRMSTLRMMTEGKSWWARMLLYAWIYALMVVLVLLVFVLPKIRFASW